LQAHGTGATPFTLELPFGCSCRFASKSVHELHA
jgi:hypothetical protein